MNLAAVRASSLVTRAAVCISRLLLVCAAASCNERPLKSDASSSSNPVGSGNVVRQADRTVRGVIVVLGSSTAAGIGPKDANHAWVARYQAYLAATFPRVTLVNLAAGGQTTFEVQPTGYIPRAGRPAPVEGRNITAALRLNPRALIVNLPSNDQANNYPFAEQLENYDRLVTSARAAHVPLWIATPQPRNFNESTQVADSMQMRDTITKKFAPRTLDFWTPFAAANGFIRAIYNAGDGTHMNDAAHAILASIVEAAKIPEQFSATPD